MKPIKRSIVLTGASRGLGSALVKRFVALGHSVEGCSRNGQRNVAGSPDIAAVDVTSFHQLSDWANRLEHKGWTPDLLICNASVINQPLPLWELQPEEWESNIRVNLIGTGYTLQAFLPSMIRRGSGVIVLISSGWGRASDPLVVPYCASKYGVEGLASALAAELPNGLGVVTLSPGIVQTDMLHRCWPHQAAKYELPEPWAERAADMILEIVPEASGQQLAVLPPEATIGR